MKLNDYLNKLNIKISKNVVLDIHNVTSDSRKCNEHSLYINVDSKYLDDAVKKGTKVIVSENYVSYEDILVIYVKDIIEFYYRALKSFYNINNGYKIGVTGTCGKTTTVSLLYETLKLANRNLLLISSNGNFTYINNEEIFYETSNTTPNIEIVYELIDKYCYDYVIIEVSSQGIINQRIEGITFDLCCFLNLSNDHLDFHKTLSNYLNAKIKLFNQLKTGGVGLVNSHSPFKHLFYFDKLNVCTFGVNQGDYNISIIESSLETMKIKIEDIYASTFLIGEYNAENISCVNAVLNILQIERKYLIECLNNGFKVGGRFEIINYQNNKIIIDFAHTEKEVELLLKHLTKYKLNHLYSIIGCGGDRDKSKRPVIGSLSVKYSDYVIFTEDNSRSEKTINIINEMVNNINTLNYLIILNRYDAIKYGINLLKENDILVIIGKGIDKNIIYNRRLSDKEIVLEVLGYDSK